jgi:threonine dehydratase
MIEPAPPTEPPDDLEAGRIAARLDRRDVVAAASRIEGRVLRTPVLRSPAIDAAVGLEVHFKAENLQHIGAFKARGAMHALARLEPRLRARGVITFSSGNHAQALALAARAFGVPATIAMPEDAPPIKRAGVEALGATVVLAGTTSEHRRSRAYELAAESGALVIQPFDHPDIVCGAGTATAELREQVRAETGESLDRLIVPVGGGGVIAGACLAGRDRRGDGFRQTLVIDSVEPLGCDALRQSLDAGERVAVEPGPTLADGLKPVRVGALNFAIARTDVADSHLVDDDDLGRALVMLLVRAKVLVEPSGAAGLAALLRARREQPERLDGVRRVGVMLTGGNVQPEIVARMIDRWGDEV